MSPPSSSSLLGLLTLTGIPTRLQPLLYIFGGLFGVGLGIHIIGAWRKRHFSRDVLSIQDGTGESSLTTEHVQIKKDHRGGVKEANDNPSIDDAAGHPGDAPTPSLLATRSEFCSTPVYSVPLDTVLQDGQVIDITSTATPQRYRLLDCTMFMEQRVLQIDEFINFPAVPYSTISYVWCGNGVEDARRAFSVEGARDADAISIDVLEHAVAASVQLGAAYIWLDRLCIMQTSRDDKAWQIRQMSHIYRSCAQCIILPGGLGKLMHLHEETLWIHRAWTLQEALAPPEALVLFAWKLGAGRCMSGNPGVEIGGTVVEVVPQQSALAQLATIVDACVVGELSFHPGAPTLSTADFKSLAVPTSNRPYIWPLEETKIEVPAGIFGTKTPNLMSLGARLSKVHLVTPDIDHAIWQCALMRTSSRPVDLIFSIMGLFGVSLDPLLFDKNDRLGATVALAQQILKDGRRASWLGISLRLPPCAQLSTFPAFPRTSVAGRALVQTKLGLREAAEMTDAEFPNPHVLGRPMPTGTMDDAGYLTLSTNCARIVSARHMSSDNGASDVAAKMTITAIDGTTWEVEETQEPTDSVETYAVLYGSFQKYFPGQSLAGQIKLRALLVERHAPGKFHVKTYFSLDLALKDAALAWAEKTITIGGPEPLSLIRCDVGQTEVRALGSAQHLMAGDTYRYRMTSWTRYAKYFHTIKKPAGTR